VGPSLGKHWALPKKMKSCVFQVRDGKNGGGNFNLFKFMRIKDIPKIDRPREELIFKGVDDLIK